MIDIGKAGAFKLGDRVVKRLDYGAMQLAGAGVFGPPKDRAAAVAVLREAVASGVNHIDTSDFYGPYVTNEIIREALHPYPDDLVIVTKIGAKRGADASWKPAMAPAELESAVRDNMRNLGLDAMEVINLRIMGNVHGPAEGSIEAPLTALADLQRQGPALAWLLQRAPNMLLIPGTASIEHLRENLAAADLELHGDEVKELDRIAADAAPG